MRLGRGEGKFSLHSITNLGEFHYFKNQFYYLKDLSPPFIGKGPVMKLTKLTQQANQKSLSCYPLLTPIVRHEGHLLENSKLMPKDALQKRYLRFPSKHLPKRLRNSFRDSPWYCLTSKRS